MYEMVCIVHLASWRPKGGYLPLEDPFNRKTLPGPPTAEELPRVKLLSNGLLSNRFILYFTELFLQ